MTESLTLISVILGSPCEHRRLCVFAPYVLGSLERFRPQRFMSNRKTGITQ